jgi:hypothetical protein
MSFLPLEKNLQTFIADVFVNLKNIFGGELKL